MDHALRLLVLLLCSLPSLAQAGSYNAGFSLNSFGRGLSNQFMAEIWEADDQSLSLKVLGDISVFTVENAYVDMRNTEFETAYNLSIGAGFSLYKNYNYSSLFIKALGTWLKPDRHLTGKANFGASLEPGIFLPLNKSRTGGFTLAFKTTLGHHRAKYIQNKPDLFNNSSVVLGFEKRVW